MKHEIDAVVIWVDGNDPKWLSQFKRYKGIKEDSSNDSSRYRDMETLKYVFRSIDKNIPWIRKIHFITEGHKPSWLNIDHPQINFLTHRDIFYNKKDLPVFNSSAIELNFLGIKDLADQFIYFNDDMIVFKKTKKERFFKEDLPVDFLIQGIPRKGKIYNKFFKPSMWTLAINNNIDLINKNYSKIESLKKVPEKYYSKNYPIKYRIKNYIFNRFKEYSFFEHYHHPQPYLKSNLKGAFEEFKEEILNTSNKKFRSETDLTQYIYRYRHLVRGEFYPNYKKDFKTINLDSKKSVFQAIEDFKKFRFICLNDNPGLLDENYKEIKKIILNGLEEFFSEKSRYEI